MPRACRRNAFGCSGSNMLRTKSASATSSTSAKPSASNAAPMLRTHASCSGDVAVPQIAYLRMAATLPRQEPGFLVAGGRALVPSQTPTHPGDPDGTGSRVPCLCRFGAEHSRVGTQTAEERRRRRRPVSGRGRARAASRARARIPRLARRRPRTIAAGIWRAFPITSSVAPAISSATAIWVARSSRPRASGLPRRSRSGAMPATPSATSVVPWRQARPNESLTTTPTSTPASSTSRSRRRRAEASGSSGSRTSVPSAVFDASTPGRRADEPVPRLGDHERRAASERPRGSRRGSPRRVEGRRRLRPARVRARTARRPSAGRHGLRPWRRPSARRPPRRPARGRRRASRPRTRGARGRRSRRAPGCLSSPITVTTHPGGDVAARVDIRATTPVTLMPACAL